MRFLVDQNIAARLVSRLTENGHVAAHAESVGLATAHDVDIFRWCREHDAILLTGDKKLTKFLVEQRATSPSVVIFRDYSLDFDLLENDLASVLDAIGEVIGRRGNAVFSVGPDRPIRVQLLPLVES